MRDLLPARQTTWSEVDLLWMAGLLEGEGSFSIHKLGAQIQCQMTDEDVIVKLARVAGVGQATDPPRMPTGRGGNKPFWRWGIYRRQEIEVFVAALHPYMGIRRQGQIDAVLAHLDETRRPEPECGTYRMYARDCRCRLCKDAAASRGREMRAQRKLRRAV